MLRCSFDPEARSLYVYFTELVSGQVAASTEYPAQILLDRGDRVIGVRVELDDDVLLSQLELVLNDAFSWLDGEHAALMVRFFDENVARRLRLEQTAILDFDADETLLGLEVSLPAELEPDVLLARLAPFMVALDEDDAPADAENGDGPVVFEMSDDDESDDDESDDDESDDDESDDDESDDDESDDKDTRPGAPALAVDGPFRAGFVALIGKPNVGKSTLLNALLGQKLAIVTPRAQTTRVPLRGILSRPGVQIVFVDTPGIHRPDHRLGTLMVQSAERVYSQVDVIGFMVDISQPPSDLDRDVARRIQRTRARRFLILNKVDVKPRKKGESYLEAYRALGRWDDEIAISARRKLGLSSLLEKLAAALPESPPLYPLDTVTDQSERQLAAEFVREQVLLAIQQEVPHGVAVEVEEWEERERHVYIRMTINVEKDSQKGILIGSGGTMLKRIGAGARAAIEQLIGRPIFLDLWVKTRTNWRDDPAALGWLGLNSRDG